MTTEPPKQPEQPQNPAQAEQTKQPEQINLPKSVLVVGLAGSGKSTLIHALNSYTYENKVPAYYVNLDPATAELDFSANVDIDRKSVV